MHPFAILFVGMATILAAIIVFRMNAFLALVLAAILVSLLAPGEAAVKITRVAEGFGRTAGSIGIVIALAAIIGKAMTESGAADRIVHSFVTLLGEKRGGAALCATGFLLSIPVFFDTVFYLLVPLARSMHARTDRHYLKYILAICAGGAATHTLVPPTPGPLAVSGVLGVDLGLMVMVGAAVAVPAAAMGLAYAGWIDRRMPVTPPAADEAPNGEAAPDAGLPREVAGGPTAALPGLAPSMVPIVLPVLLISANTLVAAMRPAGRPHAPIWDALAPYTTNLGNPNVALLAAAAVAMWLYARRRRPGGEPLGTLVESSLMSAGVIILITAAGGAFGAALQAARLGPAIESLFAGRGESAGLVFLPLAFVVASLLKIAQGSSTVAMITTAGMLAAMVDGAGVLPFHPVYVATAISSGALVVSWMNDSGFWVVSKMGGLTEVQTLKTWTPTAAVVGVTAMLMTVALALLLPMR